MKTIKNVGLLTDNEVSTRLIEIAIERGLSAPQTADEVKKFEEAYADEIQQVNGQLPSMKEVLAMANELKSSKKPILIAKESDLVDEKQQMAARKGNNISEEIHSKMDEAVKKAIEKRNSKGE